MANYFDLRKRDLQGRFPDWFDGSGDELNEGAAFLQLQDSVGSMTQTLKVVQGDVQSLNRSVNDLARRQTQRMVFATCGGRDCCAISVSLIERTEWAIAPQAYVFSCNSWSATEGCKRTDGIRAPAGLCGAKERSCG